MIQEKFEELAKKMGYAIQKKQDGEYSYEHTQSCGAGIAQVQRRDLQLMLLCCQILIS